MKYTITITIIFVLMLSSTYGYTYPSSSSAYFFPSGESGCSTNVPSLCHPTYYNNWAAMILYLSNEHPTINESAPLDIEWGFMSEMQRIHAWEGGNSMIANNEGEMSLALSPTIRRQQVKIHITEMTYQDTDWCSEHGLGVENCPFLSLSHPAYFKITLKSSNPLNTPILENLTLLSNPRFTSYSVSQPEIRCAPTEQNFSCKLTSFGTMHNCNNASSYLKVNSRLEQYDYEESNITDNYLFYNGTNAGLTSGTVPGWCWVPTTKVMGITDNAQCSFSYECRSRCCAYDSTAIQTPSTSRGICKPLGNAVTARQFLSSTGDYCGLPLNTSCDNSAKCATGCCSSSSNKCCELDGVKCKNTEDLCKIN